MRFSSKGHYGLRAMTQLAQVYGGEPVALASIAAAEGLSLGYLERLFAQLRKAKLVESTRGAQGGYCLTATPCTITAGDVIRALEGPVAPAECASEEGEAGYCQRETICLSRQVWQRLRDSITEVLDSISLADLCSQQSSATSRTNDRRGCPQCSLAQLKCGGE